MSAPNLGAFVRVGCPDCEGDGTRTCLFCGGSGRAVVDFTHDGDQVVGDCPRTETCERCRGIGYLDVDPEETDIQGQPIAHDFQVFEPAELRFCACGWPESRHRMDSMLQFRNGQEKPGLCLGFRLTRDENAKGGA